MTRSTKSVVLQVVWDDTDENRLGGESLANQHAPSSWTATKRVRLLLYSIVPLLLLTLINACVRLFDLDLRACRFFFDADTGEFHEWGAPIWSALFEYGPLPGLALGLGATVVLAVGYVWPRLSPYRRECAFIALLLALSPGLLVNGILKPLWDRPRPCELSEFGGSEAFVPVLDLRIIGDQASKSFPSGHASMGFYLLAPFFPLTQRRRGWAVAFLLFGLLFGTVMGIGRVAQGRHFPSDVVWSGAIVYFSALLLAYLILPASNAMHSIDASEQEAADSRSILSMAAYRERIDRQDDAATRRAA